MRHQALKRALPVALVAVPAVLLAALGVVMVASTTARQAAAAYGDPRHFVVRHVAALGLSAGAAGLVVRLGAVRLLKLGPFVFALALVAGAAVFFPGVGVRAAGAHRWLRLGPFSIAPAPLVTFAVALLLAAWGRAAPRHTGAAADRGPRLEHTRRRRGLALGLFAASMLLLVAEPDFSAAVTAGAAAVAALAGLGIGGRRLAPAALVVALVLAVLASRFGYVAGRLTGFYARERDRRGAGYEVIALERASAAVTPAGLGLGHGQARRRLSSPGGDYVYAIVIEELGAVGGVAVIACWLAAGLGVALAGRRSPDRRLRALALGSGAALLVPATLHVAVCLGFVPIVGVSMPFVSYDPGATLAAGVELGAVAAAAGASSTPVSSGTHPAFRGAAGEAAGTPAVAP